MARKTGSRGGFFNGETATPLASGSRGGFFRPEDGATSEELTDALKALVPDRVEQRSLPPAKPTAPIDGGMGVGRPVASAAVVAAGDLTTVRRIERIVVYSEILIQEAGAFELPDGWPNDNTYTGMTFDEDSLPVLGDPYLIQRRVHEYVYSLEDPHSLKLVQHKPLAVYEAPFAENTVMVFVGEPGGEPTISWTPATRILVDDRSTGANGYAAALSAIETTLREYYGVA